MELWSISTPVGSVMILDEALNAMIVKSDEFLFHDLGRYAIFTKTPKYPIYL